MFEKNKIDVFKEDLGRIAFYFLPINKELSKFLTTFDWLVKEYLAGENIFKTKPDEINYCWDYIKANKSKLKTLWFSNYEWLFDLASDLWAYKAELFDLLGKDKTYNYLVILQNTNEKRPNGWFFGSFAFISIQWWHIKNLEIVDSYYPDFIAYRTRIMAPDWTASFLPDRKIGYIAGNKFWFTNIDGKNLKDLYEKMFNETYDMKKVQQTMEPDLYNKLLNKYIKWVVFIRSDMIEKAIPWFTQKIWEWQFVNAAVDIIRWETRGNKKELYIKEVKQFFDEHKFDILKDIVNNFDEVKDWHLINMYLSNISTWFDAMLQKNNLTNVFSTWNIYAWDTNTSFDKVDWFVSKDVQIVDENRQIILDTHWDILSLKWFKPGTYKMNINYSLNVPNYYISFISSLEKKYAITLTDREKAILALKSAPYEDPKFGKVYKWRETKSTIYFPKNITINSVTWEIYYYEKFNAPFANWLFYQMWTNENNTSKTITINFELK